MCQLHLAGLRGVSGCYIWPFKITALKVDGGGQTSLTRLGKLATRCDKLAMEDRGSN